MSTLFEKIAVMQAAERGAEIEVRPKDSYKWVSTGRPIWDWYRYEYRVKPKPRVVYLKFASDGNHIDLFRDGPKDEFTKFIEVLE